METASLGLILNGRGRIALGEKKKGEIGIGILSGPGGKFEPGETPEACLMREIWEEWEVRINPISLMRVAHIDFYAGPKLFQSAGIFQAHLISGSVFRETAEFRCPECYEREQLPLDKMFESDRSWMPKAVHGLKFRAKVYYREKAKDFERTDFFPFNS